MLFFIYTTPVSHNNFIIFCDKNHFFTFLGGNNSDKMLEYLQIIPNYSRNILGSFY